MRRASISRGRWMLRGTMVGDPTCGPNSTNTFTFTGAAQQLSTCRQAHTRPGDLKVTNQPTNTSGGTSPTTVTPSKAVILLFIKVGQVTWTQMRQAHTAEQSDARPWPGARCCVSGRRRCRMAEAACWSLTSSGCVTYRGIPGKISDIPTAGAGKQTCNPPAHHCTPLSGT